MTIKFTVSGVSIECDKAEEAATLIRCLAAPNGGNGDPPKARESEANYDEFWSALDRDGRTVVQTLRDRGANIAADVLASAAGVERSKFKYTVRSIRSAAKTNGISPDDVMGKTLTKERPQRTLYTMSPSVKKGLAGK